METKKDIRTRALKKRGALLPEERDIFDRKIHGQAAAHPLFQNAREIYCYASFRDEVSTAGLLELAWNAGKKVAVPRVTGDSRMEFYYIGSIRELCPGYQGIPEPKGDMAKKAVPMKKGCLQGREGLPEQQESDILMILPGSAFDGKGNRIGYGKGFYDRYLQQFPGCRRMGLAYSVQCVDEIPAEPWDIRVEAVITEKGNFMSCGMNCQKIR